MKPDSSRRVYDGKQFDVVVEAWGDRERDIVEHPGAVAVVAIVGDEVTLVRQLREPARRQLLELPAGTLEAGEEPLATAKRELEEETGLRGGRWEKLAACYSSPGFCNERMHVFLAVDVEEGEPRREDDEDVELVRWQVAEVGSRLGEIEDAKTLVGLLYYLRRESRPQLET